LYHFEIIEDYCSNFGHFAFLCPFGGLVATYIDHSVSLEQGPDFQKILGKILSLA